MKNLTERNLTDANFFERKLPKETSPVFLHTEEKKMKKLFLF